MTPETEMTKSTERFYYGYIIVIASFCILLIIFGVHYAFGLFLKPIFAEFGWSRATISGAYSLSWLIQGPSSLLMGRLNDKYGPRVVLSLCGFLFSLGILLTTQIQDSWQLYISYGVFTGIGSGGAYVPIASTIARWFARRRSVMTGIAASGMGFGMFALSPVANYLIANYSWRLSYSILGAAMFLVTILAAQLLRLKPAQSRESAAPGSRGSGKTVSAEDLSSTLGQALHQKGFWLVFGLFFCFGYCLVSMMTHIAPYAIDVGISPGLAAGLVSAVGISSIVGKIVFGYFGDQIGSRKVYSLCFAAMFLSLMLPVSSKEILLLYTFAVLFGLAYGGNACSQSPLTAEMFGLMAHGAIFGALNIGFTSGATLGPFLTGFLFDVNNNYTAAFVLVGVFALAGFGFALALGQLRSRPGLAVAENTVILNRK